MKRLNKIMLALLSVAAVSGCDGMRSQGTIDAVAMNGIVRPVLDRHDAYVEADTSLDAVERTTALRSATLTRELLDAALAPE